MNSGNGTAGALKLFRAICHVLVRWRSRWPGIAILGEGWTPRRQVPASSVLGIANHFRRPEHHTAAGVAGAAHEKRTFTQPGKAQEWGGPGGCRGGQQGAGRLSSTGPGNDGGHARRFRQWDFLGAGCSAC